MTYRIDLVEMQAHATKLNNVGQQVNYALSAAQVVSNMGAFGKLGFPLAALCTAAQNAAMDTMRQAVDASVDHVKRFDGWRKHIEEHEQAQSDIFDGMHDR
ncbi:type VII secretion target [Lentzea flava]|uniref:Excreted virulence factor EspC, type VII ESX diderm n=1 Tax=Lentzea flava TaxID=103732 RepID=A0ABQ2URG9_9PSEU|nr:type VII secretion target [Lentzea flava]MCP2200925.1 Excreted virulence factor EspC, type VII ESX diderm [Lentzea flava]GGU47029.1 hypothetical protein GCM10010178_44410 [Lentzea flava]